MSYILDALKKNQAEQDKSQALRVNATSRRRRIPHWMIALVVLLVVGNIYLVSNSYFGQPEVSPEPVSESVAEPARVSELPSVPPAPPSSSPSPEPTLETVQPAATPEPIVEAPPIEIPADELNDTERLLYDELDFTSHIYTDNPDDCAVVIDGQRLSPGDGFKGLVVIEITETGVVFEENRNGRRRHVEVNVIERFLL